MEKAGQYFRRPAYPGISSGFLVVILLGGSLDQSKGRRIQNSPAQVRLAPQVNLIVAFQIPQGGIVIRIAILDNLHGDFLGVAPAEAVSKIPHNSQVWAIISG